MTTTLLIALALIAALAARYVLPQKARCPECGAVREDDAPICGCGWIFDIPDDDSPLEYGEPDDDLR